MNICEYLRYLRLGNLWEGRISRIFPCECDRIHTQPK